MQQRDWSDARAPASARVCVLTGSFGTGLAEENGQNVFWATKVGATDTSKGDFVRLLKHLDVSKQDEGARLKEILDKVLRNVASET